MTNDKWLYLMCRFFTEKALILYILLYIIIYIVLNNNPHISIFPFVHLSFVICDICNIYALSAVNTGFSRVFRYKKTLRCLQVHLRLPRSFQQCAFRSKHRVFARFRHSYSSVLLRRESRRRFCLWIQPAQNCAR